MKLWTNRWGLGLETPRSRSRIGKQSGSALTVVMVVVFMLLAVVMALHHQENVARRAYTQAEAELRFREGRRFAVRERVLGTPAPSDLVVQADVDVKTPESSHEIPENYAKGVFARADNEWSALPDLKAVDAAHAHQYVELKPVTSNSSFKVFGHRTYEIVETDIPGYALYAPKGTIEATEVEGWGNPTFEDAEKPLEAWSGVPVILGARGDIKVGNLAYGEAHSTEGNVTITDGAGIGFVGPLPLLPYEDQILAETTAAGTSLDGSTASGDKTALLNGNALTLGGIIDLMFGGGNVESLLGLRQAFHFPMPMIPGLRQIVPGVLYEFWFHVPFPPDGGFTNTSDPQVAQLNQLAQDQKDTTKLLEDLKKKVDAAVEARKAAEQAYANEPSDANLMALNAAKAAEQAAIDEYETVTDQMEAMAAQAKSIVEGKSSGGMAPVPVTRAQDPDGVDGVFGWNYSKVIGNMLGLLLDTLTGDFKNIASRLSEEVRVVHFGRKDNVPFFQFGSPFVARSTVTVPRGRTLRFNGNMEIQGDLWLQRGSVFAVHGNLVLKAPGAVVPTDPYRPSGRLFLEEGSTLLVKGDFQAQGSPQFGSVMVGGEPGEIHPLTAAILADGRVTLPNGIHSGSTLDDLVPIEALENMMRPLLESGAPNVAKIAGPFHLRRPYFARFATTFQLTIIPPTLFTPPIPIPTPIPLPKENILVFAFRALSLGYTATLNATLGENLYTHTDWWPFGDGVVPMTTKIDPDDVADALAGALGLLSSPDLDSLLNLEQRVTDFANSFVGTAMDWVVKEAIQKLVTEVATMLVPGVTSPLDTLIVAVVNALQDKEDGADQVFADFVGELDASVANAADQVLGNLLDKANGVNPDDLVREHSGAFVFAGQDLHIGSSAKLAAGMFVAGDDATIEAELTIGTVMARNGSVRTKRVLYYPYFNQASLYLPKPTPSNWLDRAKETKYGVDWDSGLAVQVGPPPVTRRVIAEGWDR